MLQAAAATLITVTPYIVRAAETADDNKKKCQQLDDRARALRAILRARVDGGGVAVPAVRTRLEMLKAAVDDAIQLVKSCQRRENGLVAWAQDLLTSESMATKLQEADARISACIGDLNFAERYPDRHPDDRRPARAEAALKQQRYHAQSAPPEQKPAGSTVAVTSLRRHHHSVVLPQQQRNVVQPAGSTVEGTSLRRNQGTSLRRNHGSVVLPQQQPNVVQPAGSTVAGTSLRRDHLSVVLPQQQRSSRAHGV